MAVALPAMFNAFFTGGVTTGAGAGTATKITTAATGETTVAAGADVAETLGTAVEIKEAKDAVKLGTRLRAALQQTGEIFMSPIEIILLLRKISHSWQNGDSTPFACPFITN